MRAAVSHRPIEKKERIIFLRVMQREMQSSDRPKNRIAGNHKRAGRIAADSFVSDLARANELMLSAAQKSYVIGRAHGGRKPRTNNVESNSQIIERLAINDKFIRLMIRIYVKRPIAILSPLPSDCSAGPRRTGNACNPAQSENCSIKKSRLSVSGFNFGEK